MARQLIYILEQNGNIFKENGVKAICTTPDNAAEMVRKWFEDTKKELSERTSSKDIHGYVEGQDISTYAEIWIGDDWVNMDINVRYTDIWIHRDYDMN